MFENLSDDELMKHVSHGDNTAFEVLFERHSRKVFGYALRLVGGKHDFAEDISQTAWMKLIRSAQGFQAKDQFIAWLFTIVRNTALNQLTRDRHLYEEEKVIAVLDDASFENWESTIDSQYSNEEEKKWLIDAVDRLSEPQRLALTMRVAEELSYAEIARAMNVSVPSVKTHLHRAKESLAKMRKEDE